jgi:4-amino-4-deoxy-L-arabinose transferase-like glycosyltransferase
MMEHGRFRYLAAMGLLVLVSFFVRAVSLNAQSLWRDEVDALRFATASWSEMLDNFTRPGWNGPLFYLLLRSWIGLAGTSEYAMRFLPLLLGVLCVPLTYQLGRLLLGSWVGIASALLTATSPYLVWYSQEVKMYSLVLALALLAIYSLRRALEGGRWTWWLTQIAATSLAFYSHILAALLIPVQVLLSLAWWSQLRKRWRGALISLGCLTLPYLPLAAWQAPLALKARETGFYPYSLQEMVVILLNGWSTGITGWGKPWATALMGLLAASGLVSSAASPAQPTDAEGAAQTTPVTTHLVMPIWLAVPLLCVWLISLRQPLFTDRYLIWTAPAFYLLVALSLRFFATAKHWIRWIIVPLLGVTLAFNMGNLWRQASIPIKSDFRAAAAYVANHQGAPPAEQPHPSPGDAGNSVFLPSVSAGPSRRFEDLIIFQIPHGRYTFDYYFPIEEYPRAEGLYTNHRTANGEYLMDEEQAAQQMRAMTRGYDAVWLIASEVSMWDERNLVQRWLDDHARRVAEGHFTRVDVYRYELPDG